MGLNRSMINDSPNGIQISSTTRLRQEKSPIARFSTARIEDACSRSLSDKAVVPQYADGANPFLEPFGTAFPT